MWPDGAVISFGNFATTNPPTDGSCAIMENRNLAAYACDGVTVGYVCDTKSGKAVNSGQFKLLIE